MTKEQELKQWEERTASLGIGSIKYSKEFIEALFPCFTCKNYKKKTEETKEIND